MIYLSDRQIAVELIDEARDGGARLEPACKILGLTSRTYQRWKQDGDIKSDGRPDSIRPEPKNKLSQQERKKILETVNSKEYASLPPSQIVPKLADKGKYIASESTFYRVLRQNKMLAHRGKAKPGAKRTRSTHIAVKPNEIWTWDITWLHRNVKGLYYKLYMIVDIFSRKIVGYEVWEEENAVHSETLVRKALLAENIAGRPIVLHSDNGGPMKAATFLATLERLGVQSSFSRPRVSNDNPYSESLFKTLKYIPTYP
ncbi:transposase InsO family protein [Marinisporobacter balticus]|uniref:Transposase InsO family protein n=1 Tax=Marinisporobacter balticus TaxID=2018667 RepID=A0A4R2LB59_9FIRM|nr:transposase InsO family protein [Marinisporobacter balticus]